MIKKIINLISVIFLPILLADCGDENSSQLPAAKQVEETLDRKPSIEPPNYPSNNPIEQKEATIPRNVCGNDSELFPESWGGYNPQDFKNPIVITLKRGSGFEVIPDTIVTLENVNDSRCPRNGPACFWEGQVQAEFLLKSKEKRDKFSLMLHNNLSSSVLLRGLEFKLISVDRYPMEKNAQNEKQVTLSVKYVGLGSQAVSFPR